MVDLYELRAEVGAAADVYRTALFALRSIDSEQMAEQREDEAWVALVRARNAFLAAKDETEMSA